MKARKSKLNREDRKAKANAAVEAIQKSHHRLNLPITKDFESLCREEVLIMAVIELKLGIKGLVEKETLAAESPGSVAINLSGSGSFPLTLCRLHPKILPFVLNFA